MKKIDNVELYFDASVMFEADDRFPQAREPVLRRMPDGTLLASIYAGGPREPHPDNLAAVVRSSDDGATWSEPEVVFKHPNRATWPSEIFTGGGDPMLIFQTFMVDTHYCELRSFYSCTRDSGRSWEAPRTFPGVPANFSVRHGRVLSDGSWLLPVYWQETRGHWTGDHPAGTRPEWEFVSGVLRSTDRGESWSVSGNVKTSRDAWENDVIELAPGHLKMFIRCECPELVLWESESFDNGATWTKAVPGNVSNPGTKFSIFRIGEYWMMANNFCTQSARRDDLELAVSTDGNDWSRRIPLARSFYADAEGTWSHFFENGCPTLPQVAYPDGFADDERQTLYLAIDSVRKFFLMKIPYSAFLGEAERN